MHGPKKTDRYITNGKFYWQKQVEKVSSTVIIPSKDEVVNAKNTIKRQTCREEHFRKRSGVIANNFQALVFCVSVIYNGKTCRYRLQW